MAIMIMATAVILVPSVFFNFYAPIKSIVLFFVVFLVLKLLSESNWVKSFIFCCFDMLINVGLELLLLGLLNLLGMNDFYDVSEFYTFSRMVSAIVFAVICIPFKYLYALLWNRIVKQKNILKAKSEPYTFSVCRDACDNRSCSRSSESDAR